MTFDAVAGGRSGGGPLQVTSTTDALVAELRKQILGGELRPGEALPEIAVANAFGVARPTVRSALQILASRNLVHRPQGRSATVPVLTADDARDLHFVRAPLEYEVVTAIVERRIDVTPVRRRLGELEALPAEASWADRVQAHTAFHIALVDAVGSPRLSRLYPPLQEEMQLCLAQLQPSYPRPDDLAREHRTLLDAVSGNDAGHARAVMREHLDQAVRRFTARE
ncbi:GntR family transcriptional regulator [Streptomyces armeniacus]|uniref:GntR family transcriptional regulator n=1 Tax=Streptomyces armeniacus TaxID=83291 RepID=A0A345XX59_9ACTN|nr:GntR family transcriptional regulator [Streptomyces armeniacus]AXK36225.1 GntR family transcriptional regulator [Streptomyces armeniacus]